MAKQVKPLDPAEATLEIDPEVAAHLGKGAARARTIEKFSGHPGKRSRRISFVIHLSRDGSRALQKHPVALRLSSRDARQLAKLFTLMADESDGIA
jgi:hypothetical protein